MDQAASGNTIYVAQGVYTGIISYGIVVIGKSVTISGGWNVDFTTQGSPSVIDGQFLRRVILMDNPNVTATMDNFKIQHGVDEGAGVYIGQGILTLSNSIISDNTGFFSGAGIVNYGTLTLNNSTVSGNSLISSANHGAGIFNAGTITVNNSTISNNTVDSSSSGSAIYNDDGGIFILNNSTVSGNTGGSSDSDHVGSITAFGTLTIRNSTITNNQGGIYQIGSISLLNSILINNTFSGIGKDCVGSITSKGYNLIGSTCVITKQVGDQISTAASPINPHLGPLANNGGSTFTHALLQGSPAINAGNPAVPGSGGSACAATDQRGVSRVANAACDIGAYEIGIPVVGAVRLSGANPTSASQVDFRVIFSKSVTGVDETSPFSDFSLTTTGLTGAHIISVSGSGNTYTVTVNTGSGVSGSIHLNIVDDDSIQDSSGNLLGGSGIGNGSYTTGPTYQITSIPTPLQPKGKISNPLPSYTWNVIHGATQYQYQLFKGTKLVYTKLVGGNVCGAATCSNTPKVALQDGAYQWHARAMINGVWKSYSVWNIFSIAAIKAGFWHGASNFYVAPNHMNVIRYTIYITVYSCNVYNKPLVINTAVPIINYKYSYVNYARGIYFSGTFLSSTVEQGSLELYDYYLPGCGFISGGDSTRHVWKNSGQANTIDSTENSTEFFLSTTDPLLHIPSSIDHP